MVIETSRPIREQVADIIRGYIIEGRMQPGQLITERELSRQLGVSTTPIKEAFRSLETEGLLITTPRSKTMVSEFAVQTLDQVSLLRSAMEGVAARVAVRNLDDVEIQQLEDLVEASLRFIKAGDVESTVATTSEFHRSLREACRNNYLIGLINTLTAFESGFRYKAHADRDEALLGYDEHRKLLQAIRSRDEDGTELLLREHIRRSSRHVLHEMNAKDAAADRHSLPPGR